eukprot:15317630-Alexandrium_andersonii.AAC.1
MVVRGRETSPKRTLQFAIRQSANRPIRQTLAIGARAASNQIVGASASACANASATTAGCPVGTATARELAQAGMGGAL